MLYKIYLESWLTWSTKENCMELNIYDAKTNFSKIISYLVEGKEKEIIISKYGKPLVKISLINKKNNKRVGGLKKDYPDFDISLEEFNSIPVEGFGL